ncbi:26S proteasome non-ATPase regulatory subunit 5 [Fennellomyces sp. T-0311]|nr:26S proteasome non-ATPase regulatory subunit 5 [Fennellomyces sp. T-0311]
MPSVTTPLERVANALDPNSSSTAQEKINALSVFSDSLHGILDQAQSVFALIPLAHFYMLFGAADGTDNEEVLNQVLCKVISKLLKPFSYDMIVSDEYNMMFLTQGLSHFSPDIRYLSLQQVEKCLDGPSEAVRQVAQSNVFTFVLATLAFQQTEIANKAVDIAVKISLKVPDVLFSQNSAILRNLLTTNETVRFRVYELIVKVAGSSALAFELGENSGLLDGFISELRSPDSLVALNVIEILRQVAITPAGLSFLEKSGLMEHLSLLLDEEADEDISKRLLKSSTFLFFGELAQNQGIQFGPIERKYHYLDKLQRRLDNEDTNKEILAAVIASIGLTGSHAEGLRVLHNTPLLAKFLQSYHGTSGDIKAEFLRSLSMLMGVRGDPAVEQMTREVYEAMEGRPTTLDNLVQTAKQPVDNIRVAAFACIKAIASHMWGREEMTRYEHVLGYLLDRTAEHSREGQRWKFDIIETMVAADDAQQTLGDHYRLLRTYVRQGPYYQPTEPAAALESA